MQFAEAIGQVRTTAKWLIGAFGAIAAALIAGISLSDLGKVHGTGYVVAAFVSVVVALLSATIAIVATARVLTPPTILLDEIEPIVGPLVAKDITLLRGQGTELHELLMRYKQVYTDYAGEGEAVEDDATDGAHTGTPPEEDAAEDDEPGENGELAQILALDSVIQYLRALALAEKVRKAFRRSLSVVVVAVVIAGLSVTTFAWAASHVPSTQNAAPTETDVDHVVVVLGDEDESPARCIPRGNDLDSCHEDSSLPHDAGTRP